MTIPAKIHTMNHEQSEEENKSEFISRLREAGWSIKEALEEWNRIQEDEEGEP